DEDLLGKREGYVVCKHVIALGGLDQRCYVANLSHYDEIVPARAVKARTPRPLKRVAKEPQLRYEYQGRSGNVDSDLSANRNTGLLVLQSDTVLVGRYQYELTPEHPVVFHVEDGRGNADRDRAR
ncbi:MAG TPA: hypothetical protein VLD59_00060, partial [Steroidobacteraceae bacterium]|nr:hypothetical protein [Steroidobacteraceae bacterium]